MRSTPCRSESGYGTAAPNGRATCITSANAASSRSLRSTPLTSAPSAAPVGITSTVLAETPCVDVVCVLKVIVSSGVLYNGVECIASWRGRGSRPYGDFGTSLRQLSGQATPRRLCAQRGQYGGN